MGIGCQIKAIPTDPWMASKSAIGAIPNCSAALARTLTGIKQ